MVEDVKTEGEKRRGGREEEGRTEEGWGRREGKTHDFEASRRKHGVVRQFAATVREREKRVSSRSGESQGREKNSSHHFGFQVVANDNVAGCAEGIDGKAGILLGREDVVRGAVEGCQYSRIGFSHLPDSEKEGEGRRRRTRL